MTLTDSAPYLGNDYLHVGDGKGLVISYIGHTTLRSHKLIFTLSNVLHIPHIKNVGDGKGLVIIMFIWNFMPLCFM